MAFVLYWMSSDKLFEPLYPAEPRTGGDGAGEAAGTGVHGGDRVSAEHGKAEAEGPGARSGQ